MGTWSASIWGNDTACDLRSEYGIAFTEYAPDVAVEKLNALL